MWDHSYALNLNKKNFNILSFGLVLLWVMGKVERIEEMDRDVGHLDMIR